MSEFESNLPSKNISEEENVLQELEKPLLDDLDILTAQRQLTGGLSNVDKSAFYEALMRFPEYLEKNGVIRDDGKLFSQNELMRYVPAYHYLIGSGDALNCLKGHVSFQEMEKIKEAAMNFIQRDWKDYLEE